MLIAVVYPDYSLSWNVNGSAVVLGGNKTVDWGEWVGGVTGGVAETSQEKEGKLLFGSGAAIYAKYCSL